MVYYCGSSLGVFTDISSKMLISILMDKYPEVGLHRVVVQFYFLRNLPYCFPPVEYHFAFLLTAYKGSNFPILVNIFHLFFLMAILIGMTWYLIVILFAFLVISDITLVIYISSLKKYVFKSLDHLKFRLLTSLLYIYVDLFSHFEV